MTRLNIPIGISDFSEIRQNNYYYIDKSALVQRTSGDSSNQGDTDHPSQAVWKNSCYEHAFQLF